ncbi:MAG: bifunctional oligoribonuclease/PAP phosphatase NrnA [Candidatus Fimimorpha sp.]
MNLNQLLDNVTSVAITGHVDPDGDCVGSCLGLYNYLKENFPVSVDVYLESFAEPFLFMNGALNVQTKENEQKVYELCFALDCGDEDRIGAGKVAFQTAKKTVCIDHHATNRGYADENLICPEMSATSEVLARIMDNEKISKQTAECLYTGIVHDTGVFQYSNVSPDTLRIAADLLEKGVNASSIISKTFMEKTYKQNRILGFALSNSILFMDGKCIFSIVRETDMKRFEINPIDLEGIVAHMRDTTGVECAIFLYQTNAEEFKVSLRSKEIIDVGKVAVYFGGGGHARAAGCTLNGSARDMVNNIARLIEVQLKEQEK